MEMVKVKSANLFAVGHDQGTRKMHVTFNKGTVEKPVAGKTFEYDDVDPNEHAKLMAAPSVGGHFAKHIVGDRTRPAKYTGRYV